MQKSLSHFSAKNASSLDKGAFDGQGQALSLRYDIEFNLITTVSYHIFVNYFGRSKPLPYIVGYNFSLRAKHLLLFTLNFSLPVSHGIRLPCIKSAKNKTLENAFANSRVDFIGSYISY